MALWLAGQVKMVSNKALHVMNQLISLHTLSSQWFTTKPVTIITSSRSVTVQWNPPQPDLQNGVIQHYLVQIVETETAAVLQSTTTRLSVTVSMTFTHITHTL